MAIEQLQQGEKVDPNLYICSSRCPLVAEGFGSCGAIANEDKDLLSKLAWRASRLGFSLWDEPIDNGLADLKARNACQYPKFNGLAGKPGLCFLKKNRPTPHLTFVVIPD